MPSVRTITSGLGVLTLAVLLLAWQRPINRVLTDALVETVAAWEAATARLRTPAPAPTMPGPREPAPAPRWRWTAPDGLPAAAPAVAPDGSLFTGTRDALIALDADGRERWRATAGLPPPVVFGIPILTTRGDVAVGGVGAVARFDGAGRLRWTHTLAGMPDAIVRRLVAAPDDGLWLAAEQSNAFERRTAVIALDAAGHERWRFDAGAHVVGALVPTPGGTLAAEIGGEVQWFGADGTRRLWERGAPGIPGSVHALSDGRLAVVGERTVTVFAPEGAERWTAPLADVPTPCAAAGAAAARDGSLAIACDDRVVVVAPDGRPRWSRHVGGRITTAPAFAEDGTLYVAADGLHAFAADGERRWHLPLTLAPRPGAPPDAPQAAHVAVPPLIGPDGTVYLGGDRNRVYAVGRDGTPRWIHELGEDDTLVWRVGRLRFLDDALLIASHGLVALPVSGARPAGGA